MKNSDRMGTPTLRMGNPIWLSGDPPQKYQTLRTPLTTEVAIVGGGITGALVAEAFARAGVGVVLLERSLVGSGSTAASSALLLREPDHNLSDLRRRYGPAASERIWHLSQRAVKSFVNRLRQLRIACDLVERDAVHFATSRAAALALEQELRYRRRAGFGGTALSSGAMRELTAIPAYGAVRTTGHAQFDPCKACRGLIGAAAKSGAHIFERSEVTRISPHRDGVRLHTRHAVVNVKSVVIATGYTTRQFRPLAGHFSLYRTYVLATSPLSLAQRRNIGLGDVMVWDTNRPYHYARWTKDHRLLMGGGDRRVAAGSRRAAFERATETLRQDFETWLPGLSAVDIDAAWEGLFAVTPDSLPYIGPHRRYPSHLFALGYGGNGLTFGFLAAQFLLEQWRGVKSADHTLFSFGRFGS